MKRACAAAAMLLVAACVLGQGFSTTSFGQAKKQGKALGPYVHSVIFYLKKDLPKGTKAMVVRDCHNLLAKIPTVRLLRVGRPAEKATPKYASSDYDIGLMILFDDYEGLQTYLEHKLHLQFVDRYEKTFEKVLVYDFSNQRK